MRAFFIYLTNVHDQRFGMEILLTHAGIFYLKRNDFGVIVWGDVCR